MNHAHRAYNQLHIIVLTGLMLLLCGTSAWGEDAGTATSYMTSADRLADPTPKAWAKTAPTQYGLINDITATYDCGQITGQRDEWETGTYEGNLTLTPVQSGSIQPTGPPTSTGRDSNACTYDADGRLTKDPSRGIANIVYNEIGMPQKVLFNNGAYISYVYLANGKKVEQKTAAAPLTLGQFPRVVPVTTIYDEAFEISLGSIKRLNVPGGYVTPRDSVFHLYVPDYHGNNVAVINTETGQAEQLTDYYPYGQPINNGLGASINPYKYGGKELLTANGYNASDFAARWLSHSLPCFQSPDPLAHETPWLSMYMYCAGDPINLIDPSGKRAYMMPGTGQWDHSSYFGQEMKKMIISLGTDWEPMPWSGSLWDNDSGNREGRVNAGLRIGNEILQDIINNQIVNGKYVGDLIMIGGHSHGGNVGLIASKIVFNGLNELYQNGDLEEMPPINVLLLNTPAIEGDDRYTLTDAQSSHINVIHVMAKWDIVAAGGRLLKGLKSLFNIFNSQSDCNIIYKDQYGMFEEFPVGLGNHMGTFPKNVQQWFQKMREQIKFNKEDETKE